MKIKSTHSVVRNISSTKQTCAARTAFPTGNDEKFLIEIRKFDFREFDTLCGLNSYKKGKT